MYGVKSGGLYRSGRRVARVFTAKKGTMFSSVYNGQILGGKKGCA